MGPGPEGIPFGMDPGDMVPEPMVPSGNIPWVQAFSSKRRMEMG